MITLIIDAKDTGPPAIMSSIRATVAGQVFVGSTKSYSYDERPEGLSFTSEMYSRSYDNVNVVDLHSGLPLYSPLLSTAATA